MKDLDIAFEDGPGVNMTRDQGFIPNNGFANTASEFEVAPEFVSEIQGALDTVASLHGDHGLTTDNIVARLHSLTCAGCHNIRGTFSSSAGVAFDMGGSLSTVETNVDLEMLNKPHLLGSLTVQAEDFSSQSGVLTEPTTDVGLGENVGFIDNGDQMRYDNLFLPSGSVNRFVVTYRICQ